MCSTVLRISKNPEGALDVEVQEENIALLTQVLIGREVFDRFFQEFSGQIILKGPFDKIKSENLEKVVGVFHQYIENCRPTSQRDVLCIPFPPYLSMPQNVHEFLLTVRPRPSAVQKLLDRDWDFLTEDEASDLRDLKNSHPIFLEFWKNLVWYRGNLRRFLKVYGDPYGFVRPNPFKMQLARAQKETDLSIRFEPDPLLFSHKDAVFV